MPARSSHFTRGTGVFVLAATLIGAAVFVSPPAHASSGPVVISTSFTASPTAIEVSLGDIFIIDNVANGGRPAIAIQNDSGQVTYLGTSCTSAVSFAAASCKLNGGSTHPITVVAYGTVRIWNFGVGPTPGAPMNSATLTIGPPGSGGSGSGGSGGGEGTASGPPDWVQMYGRPASGVCDPNFTPAWAKTPATPEGGWTPSWADWLGGPNMKPIGLICVRTLRYSPDSGRWVTV